MSEHLRPFSNKSGIVNRIRHFFDVQECSTWRGIRPYIKKLNQQGKVLDVGCGAMPYKHLFNEKWQYQGMDIENADEEFSYSEEDIIKYDGIDFPLDDETYDLVFHTEVVEHVLVIEHFLSECNRVLKVGGNMLFTVPFQARYHFIPYDYWRYTPSSLEYLLKKNGFSEIKISPRSTDLCVAAYKVLTYWYKLFFSFNIKTVLAVLLCPIGGVSLLVAQISLWCNIGDYEDCLGYIVWCKKGEKSDLIKS